jgi:nucleotide-binding universal stress UspA family protein
MKTIIAPTDFSAGSLNAVNYAADLAVITEAKLLLINIISLPITAPEITITESTIAELEEIDTEEFVKVKKELMLRTKGKIDIEVLSEIGTVEYELEEICKRKKPFAIVMSTKNSNAFERFLSGSNTLAAVRNIPYPLLIIPDICAFKSIRKIALASDLENTTSNQTIAVIKEWLSFFKASLIIINVTKDKPSSSESLVNSIHIQNQLGKFHPEFHFVDNDKIEDGIDEFIEADNPDLLIVVPQSHSLFHKSQSKPFLLHCKIPVLSISERC